MPDSIFRGLFDSQRAAIISVGDFLLCMGVSLILGLIMAFTYMYRTRSSKSFVVTLALLPSLPALSAVYPLPVVSERYQAW